MAPATYEDSAAVRRRCAQLGTDGSTEELQLIHQVFRVRSAGVASLASTGCGASSAATSRILGVDRSAGTKSLFRASTAKTKPTAAVNGAVVCAGNRPIPVSAVDEFSGSVSTPLWTAFPPLLLYTPLTHDHTYKHRHTHTYTYTGRLTSAGSHTDSQFTVRKSRLPLQPSVALLETPSTATERLLTRRPVRTPESEGSAFKFAAKLPVYPRTRCVRFCRA